MIYHTMKLDKIQAVRDSIENGQKDQARMQIRGYGVRKFFRDLGDLDYITAEEFRNIYLMFNHNPWD